jgi:3-phosphoglycerate kinase
MILVQHRATRFEQSLHNFSNSKCFGTLLAKEIESLNKVPKNSEKPSYCNSEDLKCHQKSQ